MNARYSLNLIFTLLTFLLNFPKIPDFRLFSPSVNQIQKRPNFEDAPLIKVKALSHTINFKL